jgi:predicted TIM-barrel fold metal-dependent hydrolase
VLPADLKALPKFHPLRGTVIVEASQWLEDNDWLLDLADADQFVVGIVGRLPLGSQEFKGHLKKYSKHPKYRGIRMSAANVTAVLESGVFTDFESLSDHDCSLDINGNFESLNAAAALAKRLPSLRIIVRQTGRQQSETHRSLKMCFAKYRPWLRALLGMAEKLRILFQCTYRT